MRSFIADIKTIIIELVGIIGGFFWARATSWDYEPLILLCVSIFGLVISLYFLFSKEKIEPQIVHFVKDVTETEKSNNKVSNETPETIGKKIADSPIFQREDTANHYVGLIVHWHLRLFIIHKRNPPNIIVSMIPLDKLYPSISFNTNTNEHPIFKIAVDFKKFVVKGEIIKCTPNEIELNLMELQEK
ncbi:MAG: hypothetical protein IPG78_08085 [Ignavibacteria bacterium]|nr:hypothetical protein [Ignavibacteria bacterium]